MACPRPGGHGNRSLRFSNLRPLLRTGILCVLALVLAGCAGPAGTGTMAQRISAWNSGVSFLGSGGQVQTLITDDNRISDTVAVKASPTAIQTACAVLEDDAEQFNTSDLPSPDNQLTDLLSDAFDHEGSAAGMCYQAAGKSPTEMARSAALRAEAISELKTAESEVKDLLLPSPATTTTVATTVPGT